MLRLKAILPTDHGWHLFEIAEGAVSCRVVPASDRARLDWISEGAIAEAAIRSELRACRLRTKAPPQ